MKSLITLYIGLILISCSGKKTAKDMTQEKTGFTWNVQLAGYDYKKYDEKGVVDYDGFITEFEKFPWIEQIEAYQKIQQGCSATLSVSDKANSRVFWVSIMGDIQNHTFLVGYVYPKTKKGLLGLGKEKQIRWLEIYIAENSPKVKECFKYFFQSDFEKLQSTLQRMEKYDEMEAQN